MKRTRRVVSRGNEVSKARPTSGRTRRAGFDDWGWNERRAAREWKEGKPFGTQSQSSILLAQREFLQQEILRGAQLLEQWRRQLSGDNQAAPRNAATESRRRRQGLTARQAPIGADMGRQLEWWVDRLEKALAAVIGKLDGQTHEARPAGRAD
jgi:hypothetical protein